MLDIIDEGPLPLFDRSGDSPLMSWISWLTGPLVFLSSVFYINSYTDLANDLCWKILSQVQTIKSVNHQAFYKKNFLFFFSQKSSNFLIT